jgi:hypothetical protein
MAAAHMQIQLRDFVRPVLRPLAVAAALLGTGACFAQAASQEQPSVTPYRPSVSTPASLSAPGWLEVEAGVLHEHDGSTARRDSVPYTLKLAFTPDWGVRLGGDAWVRQVDDAGQRANGGGDTSVVLKRRFAVDEASAFGVEAGATWPTGSRGIRRDKVDYALNGIYSADIGDYHTDLNLAATRLGAVDPAAGRTQWLAAAALSKSLNDRWGVTAELSGTRQSGVASTGQFLVAATRNVSRSLAIDAGAARSVRAGSSDWSVFTGFTWLAARLF